MEPIIRLENVTKKFPEGEGEFVALKDINLEFQKGSLRV